MPEEPVHISVDLEEPVRVFEVAMRGYRRDEVDAYVRATERELADLRFSTETARSEPAQVRRERLALEALRSEFAAEQADWQPSFTALGRRAEQILELAQAEADDLVRTTEREIVHTRERAMRECDELGQRAQAAAAIAEQKGQSSLAAAKITAAEVVGAARLESDRLLETARGEVVALRRERADLLAQLGVLAERMQALANPRPVSERKAIRPA